MSFRTYLANTLCIYIYTQREIDIERERETNCVWLGVRPSALWATAASAWRGFWKGPAAGRDIVPGPSEKGLDPRGFWLICMKDVSLFCLHSSTHILQRRIRKARELRNCVARQGHFRAWSNELMHCRTQHSYPIKNTCANSKKGLVSFFFCGEQVEPWGNLQKSECANGFWLWLFTFHWFPESYGAYSETLE